MPRKKSKHLHKSYRRSAVSDQQEDVSSPETSLLMETDNRQPTAMKKGELDVRIYCCWTKGCPR